MTAFLDSIGFNGWILPALLLLPMAGALALLVQRSMSGDTGDEAAMRSSRTIALWVFIAEAVLSLGLWWSVDVGSADWQAYIDLEWIPQWGARFTVGLDGISMVLVLLTTLLMPLAVLGGWTAIRERHQ